jgi:hypothetical protein
MRLLHLSPTESLVKAATLGAYRDCFWIMAVVSVIVIPGILLFRVATLDKTAKRSA